MSTLKLFLFGAPRLQHDGHSVSIGRRKGMAILSYLALTDQPQSREALATLFWPDFDQSRALSNLRRELSRLKKDLSVDLIKADRKQVSLASEPALWVDVTHFRRLLTQVAAHDNHFPSESCAACLTALEEAVALHTDGFLAGFSLPDCREFDEWQFFEAEGLRRQLADSLQALIRWYEREGEHETAITHGRRWLALDPLNELAHRELMAIYASAGQQSAALRQYEEVVHLLAEELDIEPDPETVALYQAIRTRHFLSGRSAPTSQVKQTEGVISPTPPDLADRYVVEERIAIGGQGEVFLGRDVVDDRPVIIKRLRSEMAADDDRVTRFVREGEALSKLAHPNIVRMLATFVRDGQHCIVMEYVPGGTLQQLLAEKGRLPADQVLEIGLELSDALGRAHHQGILHRDLKPENVLLAADGTPRLTDFGVARLRGEEIRLTQTGMLIGSPAYMSPEALRGEPLSPRADIWSLGVLLFELLAGRRPFEGEGITQVLVSILGDPVPALTDLCSDIPPALAVLVEQMLSKEAAGRPSSMRQVAAMLESLRASGELPASLIAPQTLPESPTPALITPPPSPVVPVPAAEILLQQEIRFCQAADGVQIAYATIGQGPPLVKAANWLSHLEYDWQSPVWRHWLAALAQEHTVIRYDERGCGLSDWDAVDMSFEAWIQDLETVVDAVGLRRFALLGISQGAAIAIAYTVRHPERVSHLVLYGGYARGKKRRGYSGQQLDEVHVLADLIRIGWGKEHPAFRQVFSSLFLPDGTSDQFDAFNELQRVSSSPENAARIVEGFSEIDVSDLLPQVSVPTLILHARGDLRIPFSEGRHLASLIPGARFVPLDSKNHILQEHEPAWARFVAEVQQFLRTPPLDASSSWPGVSIPAPLQTAGVFTAATLEEPPSKKVPTHNLPDQITPFIGREHEQSEIHRWLLEDSDYRLLTVIGPGGAGKTRLVLAAAASAVSDFPDGVWFVPLAPLSTPEHILPTLAQSTGYSFRDDVDLREQLLDFLHPKRMLLVFDNFEHLLEGTTLVSDILVHAPSIRVLVTSRERLNLSSESIMTLGGLSLPDGETATDAFDSDALRLFLERARRVRADFQIRPEELAGVIRICRLVEGMPLALELAAGWIDLLSPAEIASEIAQGLDILESASSDLPKRQRSIRATMEYSWRLLSEQEKKLLMRLTVFRGGFTRKAAAEVAQAQLQPLRSLLDKSLLVQANDYRFDLHELVRQFAAEHLEQETSENQRVRDAHSVYYLSYLHEHTEGIKNGSQLAAVAREIDNVRTAWLHAIVHLNVELLSQAVEPFWLYHEIVGSFVNGERALQQGAEAVATKLDSLSPGPDHDNAQRLLGLIRAGQGWLINRGGRWEEGEVLLREGLDHLNQVRQRTGGQSDALRKKEALVLMHLSWALYHQGKYAGAVSLANESRDLYTAAGDPWGKGLCLLLLSEVAMQQGRLAEAERFAKQAIATFDQIDERREKSYALQILGLLALARGDYAAAQAYLDDALRDSQSVSDPIGTAEAVRELGRLALTRGKKEEALQFMQRSLTISKETGDRTTARVTLAYLGLALSEQGSFDKAADFLQDSLKAAVSLKHEWHTALCQHWLGDLARRQNENDEAREFYQQALFAWETIGHEPQVGQVQSALGYLALNQGGKWRDVVPYFRAALLIAIKHSLAPLALDIFVGVARLLVDAEEPERAVPLYALAENHHASSYDTARRGRSGRKQTAERLTTEQYDEALRRGRSLDWEKAADELLGILSRAEGAGGPSAPPLHTAPFIGREQEMREIQRLLTRQPTSRLLSLVGPGGIGKTRLATAAAETLTASFHDGVTFISLAPLERADQLVPAIAQRLGLEFLEAGDEQEQLLCFLEPQVQLLVLDNFEHILDGVGLVETLLERVPGLSILATSREPLNLSSETVYRVGGLAYPPETPTDVGSMADFSAVRLFVQQARRNRPDLMIGPEELRQAGRVSRLVQGMPLALVLAANWAELLTLKEIGDEIAGSLDLLEAELHDLPARQQSVRAVFNASWAMLDEAGQKAIARLSVFRGLFSRPAAQAVAGGSLRTLLALHNKSWLQRRGEGFEIHELVRQYAAAKLLEDPIAAEEARNAHATYYVRLLQEQLLLMRGPQQEAAFSAVHDAFEQAAAAWRWLLKQDRLDTAVEQMLPTLYRYSEGRMRAAELFRLLQSALETPAGKSNLYLRAILLAAQSGFFTSGQPMRFESMGNVIPVDRDQATIAWRLALEQNVPYFWRIVVGYSYGRFIDRDEAMAEVQTLLAQLREEGEEWLLAFGLTHLAQLIELELKDENEAEMAVVSLAEALAIMERLEDFRESGYTLRALGQLRLLQQKLPEAIELWQKALFRLEQAGDWMLVAQMHWHIGDARLQMGDLEAAFRHYRVMSETAITRGNRRFAANLLSKESYEAARYGRLEHALQTRRQALALSQAANDAFSEAWCTWEMGEVRRLLGQLDEAAEWYERALPLFMKAGDKTGRSFYYRGLADVARARGELTTAILYYQHCLKEAESTNHLWVQTYALIGLSLVAEASGNLEEAQQHTVQALARAKETGDRAIALAALGARAQVSLAAGKQDLALELAEFVASHPVAWLETRHGAEKVRTMISLPPERVAAIESQVKEHKIWSLVGAVLSESVS